MMNPIRYEKDSANIVTLTFDQPGSPVNTLGRDWQAAFTEAVARIVSERDTVAGVILASAKDSFVAGAELKEVMSYRDEDAGRVFREIEAFKKTFRTLEKLERPVVAAINGSALGGGWEVALIAHHRICLEDPKIKLGLPEVTLGLIPGGGGLTKMVRLLGLQAAMPFVLEGKLFGPREAAQLGLVHELALSAADMVARARAWIAANPAPRQPWDDPKFRMPGGGPATPKVAQMLVAAPAMLVEKTRHAYPAPEAVLSAAVEGAQVDFDTALRIESRYLAQRMVSQNAKNMITAFFLNLNAIRSGASRPKGPAKWAPAKVGILGAGMMGAGIAWANATRGIACVLKDIDLERAEKGKAYSAKLLEKQVKQGRLDAGRAAQTLALIQPAASYDELKGCDLVIEAVFEKRELKARVTRDAEPLLAPGGVFASNTSTLPISGLAAASARPQRFVGIHFFSPVDKMQLVEIIRGRDTSDETVAQAFDYVQRLGKLPIVVNDARGFFTSRVFATFVMEGCAMLDEGVPPAVIENAGRLAGMPVGPLAVIDETSLALSMHIIDQTRADLAAEGRQYEWQPGEKVVVRMVKKLKRPGRAGGAGFYDYPADGRKTLWPGLQQHFGRKRAKWDFAELKDRLLYRQAIETARCFEEGVLTTAHDANIGSIFGIGFPGWTGGALQFINSAGVRAFAERADRLAEKFGPRFAPPQMVRDKAARGERFV